MRRSAIALLRFQLVYKTLLLVVLTPLAASLGGIGLSLISPADLANFKLVNFLLSPLGFVSIFVLLAAALTSYHLEHAGMLFLLATDKGKSRGKNWQHSIQQIVRHSYPLLKVSVLQAASTMTLIAPLLLIGLGLYHWLLTEYDINYYLSELPGEFVLAVGLLGLASIAALIALGVWLINWQLALPLMLFEGMAVKPAMKESRNRLHGNRHQLFIYLLLWQGLRLGFAIPLLALTTWAVDILVPLLPTDFDAALPWLVGALLLVTLAVIFISGIDSLLLAMVTMRVYQIATPGRLKLGQDTPRHLPWWFKAGFLGVLFLLVADNYYLASHYFPKQEVTLTAHRAGGFSQVENTLAGLESAIESGAELAEIDVQLTADGRVVVIHDRDLMRLAGEPMVVSQSPLAQLASVPLFSKNGQPQPYLASLDEFLGAAKDRIRLNIELKHFGPLSPKLVPAVLAAIESARMADQVVISSLSQNALRQVRAQNQSIPLGLIVTASLGSQNLEGFDFVAVNQGQLDSASVVAYKQQGLEVHVWTVNTQVNAKRAMLLGADSLISDELGAIREAIDAYNQLSEAEIILRRVHQLLR